MIYDRMENLFKYRGMHPGLDKAIEFLSAHSLKELPSERTEVDGDSVYFSRSNRPLHAPSKLRFESHGKYIDLQIGVESGESIRYLPALQLPDWGEWQGDIRFAPACEPGVVLELKKEHFAVFFPQDAHMPGIGEGFSNKIVFKIKE
ncbi:MAG: YhcH/YjgK/YiaL family protein [bacterium]|nr:YhcH/YjgK/YiaL family protein [bacterium]